MLTIFIFCLVVVSGLLSVGMMGWFVVRQLEKDWVGQPYLTSKEGDSVDRYAESSGCRHGSAFRCFEPIPECSATAGQRVQRYEPDDDAGDVEGKPYKCV